MFSEFNAEVGDQLFYKPSDFWGSIIALFGGYSHISTYIGFIDKKHMIIESHIFKGVVRKELDRKYYKYITVKRYKDGLSDKQKEDLVYLLESIVGSSYDEWSFPSTFLKSIIGSLPFLWFLRKYKPFLNDPKKYVCIEANLYPFYCNDPRSLRIDINPEYHYMSATPSNYAKSKMLLRIS
jgi:hypothetical protein